MESWKAGKPGKLESQKAGKRGRKRKAVDVIGFEIYVRL